MSLLSTKSNSRAVKSFSFFTKEQLQLLKKLNTPAKIQDFLEALKINFGDTCMSPKKTLEKRKAHCFEGALLAAAILRFHGHKPLVVDLKATNKDQDHVIAVFRQDGLWGAISKTNHAVLRYRDPIYRDIRELIISFFNEYFLDDGKKTLRSYSSLVNLSRFDKLNWMTSEKSLDYIAEFIDKVSHKSILNRKMIFSLRKADLIERKVSKFTQWKKK